MKSGLHKKWLTYCNRLVLAMLVIDSEARSRKFPAKPTCSIQADALHTTQNGETIEDDF